MGWRVGVGRWIGGRWVDGWWVGWRWVDGWWVGGGGWMGGDGARGSKIKTKLSPQLGLATELS